jgi:hypothetical protein
MSATRRGILGAALTAPVLAQLTGTATAAQQDGRWGRIANGWAEVRWTAEAQAVLDQFEATVKAVSPARMVGGTGGPGIRFPVRSARGNPSTKEPLKAQGNGVLGGGIAVSAPMGEFRIMDLGSVLENEVASASCVVNGVDLGHQAVFRCGLDEGRLSAETVPAGRPTTVRIAELPLRATPELWQVFVATVGEPAFRADTVLGRVTAEGVYTPPEA